MPNSTHNPEKIKALLFAAVAETMCVGAGIAAWLLTDKLIWLVIGIVAGAGFSIPAVIKFARSNKEEQN